MAVELLRKAREPVKKPFVLRQWAVQPLSETGWSLIDGYVENFVNEFRDTHVVMSPEFSVSPFDGVTRVSIAAIEKNTWAEQHSESGKGQALMQHAGQKAMEILQAGGVQAAMPGQVPPAPGKGIRGAFGG